MTMMKKGISSISEISDKSFLDDTSVMESSVCSKRLTRKTNQSTASRRSLSRCSSSKSQEKPDLSCFFIKMSSLNMASQKDSLSTRNNLILRDDNDRQKKRSPTPVPGYLMKKRQKDRQKEKKDLEIEDELRLVQLQTKYNLEKEKVRGFQTRVQQLQKQIKAKIRKIDQLSVLLVNYEQREKDMANKIKRYEDLVVQNESNLTQTKSKLQRLKNTIKINRYSQLETDNGRLRKQNEKLAKKIKQLQGDNKDIDNRCIFLEKELFVLKKKTQLPRGLSSGKGEKGDIIDNLLKARDQYIRKLQEKVAKLEIKLNFINRKKLEQVEKFKAKKDDEMHNLRTKIAYLNSQLRNVRIQNQKLRSKGIATSSATLIPLQRKNSFLSAESLSKHQQIFCLSLSPEHLDN